MPFTQAQHTGKAFFQELYAASIDEGTLAAEPKMHFHGVVPDMSKDIADEVFEYCPSSYSFPFADSFQQTTKHLLRLRSAAKMLDTKAEAQLYELHVRGTPLD